MRRKKRMSVLLICGNNVKSVIPAVVERYAAFQRWHLQIATGGAYDVKASDYLKRADVNGIIIEGSRSAEMPGGLRFGGIPTVTVNAVHNGIKARCSVNFDDRACGRMAAEELLRMSPEAGAFIGSLRPAVWSEHRLEGFRQTMEAAGKPCQVYSAQESRSANAELSRFIRRLPKPCGIFAVHDVRARQVVEACRKLKLRVPDDVAVVGVDNDTAICESTVPTISSVMTRAENVTESVGWKAAEMLDALMRGETANPCKLFVPPDRIVRRMSTAGQSALGAPVVKALEFIRLNACSGIGVRDVVKASGVSSQLLYLRFGERLGRTISDEIHRVQIDEVKRMLSAGSIPLGDLAGLAGFASLSALQRSFKRATGMTMRDWRIRHEAARPCRG